MEPVATPKGRGRPRKFTSDEARTAHNKEYRKNYNKRYYETKKEIICEKQRAKYMAVLNTVPKEPALVVPRVDVPVLAPEVVEK